MEVPAISKHLSNIYAEEELIQEATVSKMETVQLTDKGSISRKSALRKAKMEYEGVIFLSFFELLKIQNGKEYKRLTQQRL